MPLLGDVVVMEFTVIPSHPQGVGRRSEDARIASIMTLAD